MSFMEIALISVIGAALFGLAGIVVKELFKRIDKLDKGQDELKEKITNVEKEARADRERLHNTAMEKIASVESDAREHREKLHAEAVAEIKDLRQADAELDRRTSVLETRVDHLENDAA